MVEELKIYRDISELIKRVFIIVKNFPRDQPCRDVIYNFWRNESSSFTLYDFFHFYKLNDNEMTRKIKMPTKLSYC